MKSMCANTSEQYDQIPVVQCIIRKFFGAKFKFLANAGNDQEK